MMFAKTDFVTENMVFFGKKISWLLRMYIVLLQGGIFCSCLSGTFGLWCHSILEYFIDFFCLDYLSIGDQEVLKSPTTTVLGSFCVFQICVGLMKFSALTLGTYKLTNSISSWCIVPCISMSGLYSFSPFFPKPNPKVGFL
jgi:hypothetical protein